ncbi:MAG: histone deacetylase family protein [Desulfomonilia bacterium]|nr:histone deacetylase family protein [Desulfomonilia bacterium]
MKVVFDEEFHQVYTGDPAADEGRMEAIMEVIGPHVQFVNCFPASQGDIEAVHSADHIEHVKRHGLHSIASLAAGGAIKTAITGITEPCFGLIRPPGHHASTNSAWGFCFYNNMAIALEHLRRSGVIQTAYVLDIDLHFGDGTVNILQNRGFVTIHNVSAHERRSYLEEVREEMDLVQADIIGISAGFDNHEQDWGGVLRTDDYRTIGQYVRSASNRNTGGCFAILEGGYNHRVLGHNVLALIEGLSEG